MKISGRETKSRDVTIEVDKDDLYRQLERLVVKTCPTLRADAYIKDGFLYEYSYTHPHNNDEVFNKTRQATEEEKQWMDWLTDLRNLLKR